MRILLIVNATASSVTARRRVVIQKALSADHDLEVTETSRRGHAGRLAAAAAREGVDIVVVLAGDGTLSEAADGLAGSTTALAPLPGGSTNVYARTLGVAKDPIEATGQLLDALDRKSRRRVGMGSVNGRRFLFHSGIGFDAAVIEQVEKRAALKRYVGHPLFIVAAFRTWARGYDHSHPRFHVEFPDGSTIESGYYAIVSKTSPYSYLGSRPIVIAPEAGLDRPLTLHVFETLDMVPMLSIATAALTAPRLLQRRRGLAHRTNLEQFTIVGSSPFPYQVDGDYLGDATRLEYRHEPDAITIVVP